MSLVRPSDPSPLSYGSRKLYSLKGSNNAPDLSTQRFRSGKHRTMHMNDTYCSESYEKYFLDFPIEELSISGISTNSCHLNAWADSLSPLCDSFTPFDACQSNSDSGCLESTSPDQLDFEDDQVRLKLQELERDLLGDPDVADYDVEMLANGQSMEIDSEWANSIQDALLQDSPKESSSTDSNFSAISSNKDASQISSQNPRQMLLECAFAISEENFQEAAAMIEQLRGMVSVQGDPSQRIAAYMVEGLAARLLESGKCLYKALRCKEPPSSDRLAAMQILFEVCPCFKFGFMAANCAIIEAAKDEKKIHIIDFDVSQGTQYIKLIQMLAAQPGKPPHLRLTGVDDPESVQRPVGGLKHIGQRLEQLAKALQVPFEFRAIASNASDITPSMLASRPGEALIVNFAFLLHHMPDESVSTVNLRDRLLQMVKSLNPKLVTVVEQDMNSNTTPFFTRFVEAYDYYAAVYDSLDATLPRDSQDRINVERQCLAKDIVNIVACEGEERVERYEVAGKWWARMTMAGFTSCSMSQNVTDPIRKLIEEYCDRFKMYEEMGTLHFGWEKKSLVVTSAWR
ncbi:scarecrow-like protein 1 [Benincasa hispida]|uniref:scarecrow-like protein 1 n=1 Tax=Benincasa hispida TaxID=102211 RepID=UPI0019024358|nr:scarecrow-like protein 1 [Benincasa hispida]XP_038898419.1 scarecrow-like protein 1 [Benincasa hispida]XP_038898420.1 scarecrow-like protein 1 [Benincasa hispida]